MAEEAHGSTTEDSPERTRHPFSAYRRDMARCVAESFEISKRVSASVPPPTGPESMPDPPSTLDLEQALEFWHRYNSLLVQKANLHILAVLLANRHSNIHSMAIHMRIVLECAGQVANSVNTLFTRPVPKGNPLLTQANYDFFDTMIRLFHRHYSSDDLNDLIRQVDPEHGKPRRTRKLTYSDRVKYLMGGQEWYSYLSDRFVHTEAAHLVGISYHGGVQSSNLPEDHLAFACLLDYLGRQTIYMLACTIVTAEDIRESVLEAKALLESVSDKQRRLSMSHRSVGPSR